AAARTLLTHLRSKTTAGARFCEIADRVCTLLAEQGLAQEHLIEERAIETPCGPCQGFFGPEVADICVVSIVRSGDILTEQVRKLLPGVAVGKILIQRDEDDHEKRSKLFYKKLPSSIGAKKTVLLVRCTASQADFEHRGSAINAIKALREAGVEEECITFLNVISCPEGIQALRKAFPSVHIVTLAVDPGLNDDKFIVNVKAWRIASARGKRCGSREEGRSAHATGERALQDRKEERAWRSSGMSLRSRIAAFEESARKAADPKEMQAKISEFSDRKKYNFSSGLQNDLIATRAALRAVCKDGKTAQFDDLFQYTDGRIANLNRILQNLKRAKEITFDTEIFFEGQSDDIPIILLDAFWEGEYEVDEG
ncbi:Uracil phosphoribosyltransferase (UPRTase) (UMP pyrophosphorylase), partial [Durusdinium trenchii]